jgi:hypothetical protein
MSTDNSNHGKPAHLADPHEKVDGKSLADWSAEWMKWVFHAPAASPTGTPFGTTGDFPEASPDNAQVDNNGDVFFLFGGNWGNAANPAIPTIDVGFGKPIFLPMINAFDIEALKIETISGFVANGRGSFADEAAFVTHLAEQSITEAHLTVTRVGDTKPLIDAHGSESTKFTQDTGTFALGAPRTNPIDYIDSLIGSDLSFKNLPFTEEIGRWAMIEALAPGDYIVNFGGTGNQVVDPVTKQVLFNAGWGSNTTDTIHVEQPPIGQHS